MWLSSLWLTTWIAGGVLGLEARVDAMQAVERARHALMPDTPVPLDRAWSRDVLAERAARDVREELLLTERFGIRVSPEMLSTEFERIEGRTQDPEQWAAMKHALGDDRRRIEETICRPLVVKRQLRQRFAFDEAIHAEAHAKSRFARSRFLKGQSFEGSVVQRLARSAAIRPDALVPLHPDALRALEAQLRRPGDVSTVLSEWDRFSVYRLIESTEEAWTVEAAVFPKRDFESWFRETTAMR